MDEKTTAKVRKWRKGKLFPPERKPLISICPGLVSAVFPALNSSLGNILARSLSCTKYKYRLPKAHSTMKICSLLFSGDGRYIVTGCTGGAIRSWDAFSGSYICNYTSRSGKVHLAMSSDSRTLYSAVKIPPSSPTPQKSNLSRIQPIPFRVKRPSHLLNN